MLSLPALARRVAISSLVCVALATSAVSEETRVPPAELAASQPLLDLPIGKADAPITMIEYASLACTHCARFHDAVWPVLLKDYVETGKVRFILREFPYEPLATAAFMLARCEGPEKRNAVVDLLFETQRGWAFGDKPLEALEQVLRQTGMGHAAFEACLKDQTLYKGVVGVHDRAAEAFGVHATPTFFVDGTRITGEIDLPTLRKLLDSATARKS